MDSRITGNGCVVFPSDAGVVIPPDDAGVIVDPDAGTAEPDGGVEPDAGTPAELDAGPGEDAGIDPGPSKWDTYVPYDTGKIRPGCGCNSPGGGELLAVLAGLAALGRRRSRR
jgi:MYXO-CTERM domain-containing protein